MTALAANYVRPHKVQPRRTNVAPANAGEKFYTGGYALREAATGLVTKVVAAGNIPLGTIVEPLTSDDPIRDTDCHLDNTLGADGSIDGLGTYERVVRYAEDGEPAFVVSGGTPAVGNPAYLVDDNTVSANDPGHGIVAGEFTRPAEQITSGWFIDTTKKRPVLGGASANIAPVVVTFTASDPSITPDAAITVADGSTPTVAELLEYCEELNATLSAVITALEAQGITLA